MCSVFIFSIGSKSNWIVEMTATNSERNTEENEERK
jgi:hypothetical protein